MLKHIVVGGGEVGSALNKIVGGQIHDPFKGVFAVGTCDVLHISFPYFKKFVQEVAKYKKQFGAKLVIIHSSVPVGTSRKCGAVHSPIRGVHPHLEKGIRTFVKYFGGKDAKKAAKIFHDLGLSTKTTTKQENTEAGKLWDTTQYGIFILLNKEIKSFCDKNGLDFDFVYNSFNETYNDGYTKLGRGEVVRPRLKFMPGKIGGHCVIPNAKLLKSKLAKLLV